MDPIANMLTIIANAGRVKKESVVLPYSKLKLAIAKVLEQNELLQGVEVLDDDRYKKISLQLKYQNNRPAIDQIKRVSKPGLRVYAKVSKMPKPKTGKGILILSTPAGILSHEQAIKKHVGGEILCEVIS